MEVYVKICDSRNEEATMMEVYVAMFLSLNIRFSFVLSSGSACNIVQEKEKYM